MFVLATPWALACLPLPLIIYTAFPRAKSTSTQALNIPFFNAIAHLQEPRIASKEHPPLWLIIVWTLIVFAAAGPRWVGEPLPQTREGHNIILALDISGSMALDDMVLRGQPRTRLDIVKRAANAFISQRTGDRIGLILFGTRAYLQTPLTYDKHTVHLRINDASVGLAGNATAIGDPIGLAIKHLRNAPSKGRLIILLTDGANNSGVISPLKAAELAQAEGIKIHTIGLGATSRLHTLAGLGINAGGADLDEETLKKIASTTGGQYFRATDQASLQHIYQLINQMETVTQEQATIRPQQDYYPWPLGFAFCLFLGGLLHETGFLRYIQQRLTRRKAA